MNTSQFMDKQIMDLSSSHKTSNADKDFMDLNTHPPQEDHHDDVGDAGGDKKDEILPSYDFQPIRPITSSQISNFDSTNVGGARVWASAEFKPNFGTRSYSSLDSVEPSKVGMKKDHSVVDAALISEIDRTMKKHADNLMHALEGVSARLSQLETRSRNLENSLDDLRISVGNNHGNTDGKLRQIENVIREVQAGVLVVKDKQEILETQLQLSQVQISKPEQRQPEPQIAGRMEPVQQQAVSAPLQSHQQPSMPIFPNAPPPPNPQNLAPPVHHPNQFTQNVLPVPIPISHPDSYYQPPGQTAEAPPPPQQFQLPPPQQVQPPMPSPPSPRPQYQAPAHIQYSQPPPMALQQPNPSQNQPPSSHHSEELAYLSSQSYPPNARQPGGGPPPQQFHGNPQQMYEPPSGRSGPGFPSQYGSSPGFGEPYGYGGSHYGSGSPVKSQPSTSSLNMGTGGGSGYPQLPTARILPQALPTATAVGGGSSSSGSGNSGNRVPIDDVVDKVTNMGFPRDQVRATVRKLTENGQAVDLNVVLDKLMTDGVESQNPRAWFGR